MTHYTRPEPNYPPWTKGRVIGLSGVVIAILLLCWALTSGDQEPTKPLAATSGSPVVSIPATTVAPAFPDVEKPAAYLFTESLRLQGITLNWKQSKEQYPELTAQVLDLTSQMGPKVCAMDRVDAVAALDQASVGNVAGWTEANSERLVVLLAGAYC